MAILPLRMKQLVRALSVLLSDFLVLLVTRYVAFIRRNQRLQGPVHLF